MSPPKGELKLLNERLLREKKPPRNTLPATLPQYWCEESDCYKRVTGEGDCMSVHDPAVLERIDRLIALFTV